MKIAPSCVVTLTWTLSDAQNRPIDELADPVEFFVGGHDLLESIEQALLERQAGESLDLHLEPEQAFGDYRPELVCFEDRSLFPEQVEVGMAFEGLPAGSRTEDMPAERVYIVTEVYPSHVVLDGNHPLAGMALRLHVRIRDVREASAEELEAGSVSTGPLTLFGQAEPMSPPRH